MRNSYCMKGGLEEVADLFRAHAAGGTLALLPAPFAHFIGHSDLLRTHGTVVVIPILLSLAASGFHDFAAFRRIHPVSLWIALGMFLLDNLSATMIGHNALWLRLAHRLVV